MEDWLLPLQQGQPDVAWDVFLTRYRKLLLASLRHYIHDHDDQMDAFAFACDRLRANGMHRLRSRAEDPAPRAKYSTWLVTVTRHLAIDWVRQRDGRRRQPHHAAGLTPRQHRIFELVVQNRHGHVEAYELMRSRDEPTLRFREFLADLRATYRAVNRVPRGDRSHVGAADSFPTAESEAVIGLETSERTARLREALGTLAPEDRVAVELYLLEGLRAEHVATILGLANAKSVYNRVYRALAELQARLADAGIHRGDL